MKNGRNFGIPVDIMIPRFPQKERYKKTAMPSLRQNQFVISSNDRLS